MRTVIPAATASLQGKLKLATHLGGTADAPTVIGMQETGGQSLLLGAVGDGQVLARSGTTVVGSNAATDDMLWAKPFFANNSLLPATQLTPASNNSVMQAGTERVTSINTVLTRTFGQYHCANALDEYGSVWYDLGAARSKILLVAGSVGSDTYYVSQHNTFALALAQSNAAANPANAYAFWDWANASTWGLYKQVATGGWTGLVTTTKYYESSPLSRWLGMALYYDNATDTLRAFIRHQGGWTQILTITDATFTTFQYVGLVFYATSGGNGEGVVQVPLQIWYTA